MKTSCTCLIYCYQSYNHKFYCSVVRTDIQSPFVFFLYNKLCSIKTKITSLFSIHHINMRHVVQCKKCTYRHVEHIHRKKNHCKCPKHTAGSHFLNIQTGTRMPRLYQELSLLDL